MGLLQILKQVNLFLLGLRVFVVCANIINAPIFVSHFTGSVKLCLFMPVGTAVICVEYN